MPDYERKPLQGFVGYAGSAPEVKESSKGEFTTFRLGVNRSYDREDPNATQWYSVAINKPEVQEYVQETIRKGLAVAVEGYETQANVRGVVYDNIVGFRVGLIDWFVLGDNARRRDLDEDL